MRRLLTSLFVVLILSACGSGEDRRKINIAVVGKVEDSYWDNVKLGAEAAGRYLNVSVRFLAPSKKDPEWQREKIKELITKQIDGIAFAASDSKSITPSILKAMQSDIPCVAIDTDVSKSRHAFIGTDNYQAGRQAGEKMMSLLEDEGKVVIVADSSQNSDSIERIRGFEDALSEHAGVEIAATLGKEDDPVQLSDVRSLFSSHQDLDGIFCASDSVSLGVAKAVQKIKMASSSLKVWQVKIICIGESPDIMSLVQEKVIQAAVARRPYRMGLLSVLVLHNMAKVGITNASMILPESETIDTGVVLVTPLNIIQYREHLEELGAQVKF